MHLLSGNNVQAEQSPDRGVVDFLPLPCMAEQPSTFWLTHGMPNDGAGLLSVVILHTNRTGGDVDARRTTNALVQQVWSFSRPPKGERVA